MMKQLTLLLGLTIGAIPCTYATDLASALRSGKVCEKADGYIQATSGNECEMAGLVAEVNNKRTGVYSEIAAKEGISPADVGVMMAKQEKAANPGKFCN